MVEIWLVCLLISIMMIELVSLIFYLQELLQLEEDVKLLEEMYPQGEKVMIKTSQQF